MMDCHLEPVVELPVADEEDLAKHLKVKIKLDFDQDGFEAGLKPDRIIEVTEYKGQLYFLMSWHGEDAYAVVPAKKANVICPQKVIEFYEGRITFKSDGLALGYKPQCILGLQKMDGDLFYLVKWEGIKDLEIVPRTKLNTAYPQMVIEFYEKRIVWRVNEDTDV